ncbi:MAG: SMC family ATPase [bacterium]
MIPLKLELKNFLSYGSNIQSVDFGQYSLICLSGRNGNGKSALLDAVTWVLWGQARKVSGTIKPDDGLLRLGQTRMMVSLEFEFAGSIYRVRREYSKTYGKPLLVLDLEIFDKEKEKFLPLTEKTIKFTQDKIEKLLGLDYITFINSAFLRQGQADEFSKKTPKERKQILSNILGLSRYDDLSSLALQRSKQLFLEIEVILKLKENDELEVLKEGGLRAFLVDEQAKLKKIKEDSSKQSLYLKALEQNKAFFLKNKDQYVFFKKELECLIQKYDLKSKELLSLVCLWKKAHYKSLKLPSLELLQKQKLEIEIRDKDSTLLQKKSLNLQEKILKQKNLYQEKYNLIRLEKEKWFNSLKLNLQKMDLQLEQIVKGLEQKEKECNIVLSKKSGLEEEVKNLTNELSFLPNHNKTFEDFKNVFDKRKSFYQLLIQRGNWLKSSIAELKDRFETIKKQESPSCPLCEQVLTLKRKSFLSYKFLKDIDLLKYRLSRPTALIDRLKQLLLIQHEDLKKIQEKDNYYKKQKARLDEIAKSFIDYEKNILILEKEISSLKINKKEYEILISKEQNNLKKEEKHFEKELSEQTNLVEIKTILEILETEKQSLNYDFEYHEKIQIQLAGIVNEFNELEKLKESMAEQQDKKVKINLLVHHLKDFKLQLFQYREKIKNLGFVPEKETDFDMKLRQEEAFCLEKSKEKDKILQQLTLLEYELKRIAELTVKLEKSKKELEVLQNNLKDYQIISQAFGKNGIQALLIEQAIPQIEEEANNILSRLTDNQSQIFIESLRDLKSGGVKETLDIKISDSAGIRPYEMFSGGEGFRVDFALRIAISKLLARRAGIALQTLIIDEGFGSQDEEGLSRLMDAIYAIKKDFSKVIVVSHLASFKDNFPVHFVIEKDSSGSFVSVQERG